MQKKVSIILIHYNQPEYVEIALDSIFKQTYKNIELVFADDGSKQIDLKHLKDFCSSHNKNKIDIIWQINKKNMGTVKNVNSAVKKSSGDYILIFAADDKLYDNKVIEKFVKSFEKAKEKDLAMIFGQCFMMDKELKNLKYKFIEDEEGYKFSKLNAFDQYKYLTTSCLIAMGACMLDASILKKEGLFDESYKYIEDWSEFIILTRKGYRAIYNGNINALLHRDGGISHSEADEGIPAHILGFRYDIIKISTNEVFPFFKKFNYIEKCKIMDKFYGDIAALKQIGGKPNKKIIMKFKLKNFWFFLRRRLDIVHDTYNYNKNILGNIICKLCIFAIASINIKGFLSKKSHLFFDIVIYIIILLLAIELINLLFKSLIYFAYELKRKIKGRR